MAQSGEGRGVVCHASCGSTSPSSISSPGQGQASCGRGGEWPLVPPCPKTTQRARNGQEGCLGRREDVQRGGWSTPPPPLAGPSSQLLAGAGPGWGSPTLGRGSDLFRSEERLLLGEAQAVQLGAELVQVFLAHVVRPCCWRNKVVKGGGGKGSLRGCLAPWLSL